MRDYSSENCQYKIGVYRGKISMHFVKINALFKEKVKLSQYFSCGYTLAQFMEEPAILIGKLAPINELVYREYLLSF